MAFVKSNKFTEAELNQIASSTDYNNNFANLATNSIVGMDSAGNFADVNLGDETLATPCLIKDIKARDTYKFKLYDSFENLKGEIDYNDLFRIQPTGVYAEDLTGAGPFVNGEYYLSLTTGGDKIIYYIYLKVSTGSGWSEAIIPKPGWQVIIKNNPIYTGTSFFQGYVYTYSYEFNNWYQASIYVGERLRFQNQSLQIISGVVEAERALITTEPESGTTDEIDTINLKNATRGDILRVRAGGLSTITLKDGTGNLDLLGSDIIVSGPSNHYVDFMFFESVFRFIGSNIADNFISSALSWTYTQNGKLFQSGRVAVPSGTAVTVPIRDYGHTDFSVVATSANLASPGENLIVTTQLFSSSSIKLFQINDYSITNTIMWQTQI